MALIVLTSAAGAPGVTTTAVGLTLAWPRSVIMVDADPGAYQAVLAGYLRGQVATGKGLQRVAEAHRDRRPLAEVVSDETVPLADDSSVSRRLLPGFARPANAALFGPVWPDLAETFARYESAGIDVVVDAGRMDGTGLPQPLVDRADLVALLMRTTLRSIAAVRSYATVLKDQARLTGVDSNIGLVLVGENQPYGGREITRSLGIPVIATVAADVESAAAFSDGSSRGRRFDRAPLPRSLHRATGDLGDYIRRRRTRLGLDDLPEAAPDARSTAREPIAASAGDHGD
jgi:hypothetical protein